jgi:uncharacterized protein (UPF0276 family)
MAARLTRPAGLLSGAFVMSPAIGYAMREQNRMILDDPAIDAVEIAFDRANDPLRAAPFLGERDLEYVSVHSRRLSVGSVDPPAWNDLEALYSIAQENGAAAISAHLGFTLDRDHGAETGHCAPLPRTESALDVVCRNINLIQEYFHPLPFFIENIASLFEFRGTMSEAEFLSRVLERTGCGWLLHLTNLYANGRNFGFDPGAFIAGVLPIPRHVQIHLAGGFRDEDSEFYEPSRSLPVLNDVFRLYRQALQQGREKIDAVFIDRDPEFPGDAGWREEIERARGIAEEIEAPI